MESPEYVLFDNETDQRIRNLQYESQAKFDELYFSVINFFRVKITDKFERAKFISRLPDRYMRECQLIYRDKLKDYLCRYISEVIAGRNISKDKFLAKLEGSDKKQLVEVILHPNPLPKDLAEYENASLTDLLEMLKIIGVSNQILSQFPEAFNAFDVIENMEVVEYLKRLGS